MAHSTDLAGNHGTTILLPASAPDSKAAKRSAGVKNVYCTISDRRGFGVVAGVGDQKKSRAERDAGVFLVLHRFEREQYQLRSSGYSRGCSKRYQDAARFTGCELEHRACRGARAAGVSDESLAGFARGGQCSVAVQPIARGRLDSGGPVFACAADHFEFCG